MGVADQPLESDEQDRLIDVLLREELGGQVPPNLTQRILVRAFPAEPRSYGAPETRRAFWRRRPVWAAGVAAAALLAFLILPRLFKPAVIVAPALPPKKDNTVVQAERTIKTEDKPLAVKLGDREYVALELDPHSALRVQAEGRTAAIALERGKVACKVDRGVGTFAVTSDLGRVEVTGTQFSVRRAEEASAQGVMLKRLLVNVASGSVEFSAAGGKIALREKGEGGAFAGILINKSEQWIEVRADGEKEPRRYPPRWIGGMPADGGGLDKEILAAIRGLATGNRVEVAWVEGEGRRIFAVRQIVPKEKTGSATATVLARGDAWIEVKDAGGVPERYTIRMRGDKPHSDAEKEMLHVLEKLKPGDAVRIDWSYDERKRIEKIAKAG